MGGGVYGTLGHDRTSDGKGNREKESHAFLIAGKNGNVRESPLEIMMATPRGPPSAGRVQKV